MCSQEQQRAPHEPSKRVVGARQATMAQPIGNGQTTMR